MDPWDIEQALGSIIDKISDRNYEQSLACCRFWFNIGQAYPPNPSDLGPGPIVPQDPPDQILNAIWCARTTRPSGIGSGEFDHPTAHLILRLARDVGSDRFLAPHGANGLQSRLCDKVLLQFFRSNMSHVRYGPTTGPANPSHSRSDLRDFYGDTNLLAHCINLGLVEEDAIRNHILQSLISYPKLHDHQAGALIILFKRAGATIEAYGDRSVIDRCFKLLKDHDWSHGLERSKPAPVKSKPAKNSLPPSKSGLPPLTSDLSPSKSVQPQIDPQPEKVSTPCTPQLWCSPVQEKIATPQLWDGTVPVKSDPARIKSDLVQEVIALRGGGWEGLPPPPLLAARKSKPTGKWQEGSSATPVTTSLGLPNRYSRPQPPPLDTIAFGTDAISTSPTTPTLSAVSTLSDFTITDPSDDESPADLKTVTRHGTLYLEDGNVEVLCGGILFRVHTSVMSLHSTALRQVFTQTTPASAESPNGCPRIRSSDTATDFAVLLNMIYRPGFLERNKALSFTTFSSLLRIEAKYELPTAQSRLLEVVRDAYPEAFEGLASAKPLGENVFSGPTPHPNAVLSLFVQQKLRTALPMAYYMAARRGLDSLMDTSLPRSATLSPEVLHSVIRGLMKLRDMEREDTYRLIFGPKDTFPCSALHCPSYNPTSVSALQAYQKIFDHIVGSSQMGTKILQVPEFYENCGGGPQCVSPSICRSCVERWEFGHAELRKKAWTKLPEFFGLEG